MTVQSEQSSASSSIVINAMKLVLLTILFFYLFFYGLANFRYLKLRDGLVKQSRKNDTSPKEEWFTQFLNHFDSAESSIWSQRYYTYADHYKQNGPVFLLLGGTESVHFSDLVDSYMVYMAKEFGAMCFLLEHRFFGMSEPTENLSTKNLNYLSIDQVLNDIAYFIQKINLAHNLPKDTKWVLFGSDYGGSLAAWMRSKFPHLVYGAVADSAPMVAQVNFPDLYSVTENQFRKHSAECIDTLTIALEEVRNLFSSSTGQETLGKLLNLCKPISVSEPTVSDLASLNVEFLDTMAVVALTNIGPSLDQACNILLDGKRGPPMNRLAGLVDLSLEAQGLKCTPLQSFEERVRGLQSIGWSDQVLPDRQLAFQMCSETGWFRSTTRKPFKIPADFLDIGFFELLCDSVFEEQMHENLDLRIEITNLIYGGLDVANTASRIIFVYGSDDPWRALGIPEINNDNILSLHVSGAGNEPLEKPPSTNDIPSVAFAKNKVKQLVDKWLHKS